MLPRFFVVVQSSLLLSAFAILLAGCDSGGSQDPDQEEELALGTVTASIDGREFEMKGAMALQSSGLTLSVSDNDGTLITTNLYLFTGEGTYSINQSEHAVRIDVPEGNAGSASFLSNRGGNGVVEVTDLTEEGIQGTFQFTASDENERSVQVTEGKFYAPLIQGEETIEERVCDDEVFIVIEQRPELIGGMAALQERLVYPEFAERAGIEGRVFVQFIVGSNGEVFNPQVTQGIHNLLDAEATRLAFTSSFRPGRQRGNPECVQMSLPVTFRLG